MAQAHDTAPSAPGGWRVREWAAGVLLAAIFQSRFQGPVRQLKHAVEEGRFGKLALGSARVQWFRDQDYYDSSGWRGTWATWAVICHLHHFSMKPDVKSNEKNDFACLDTYFL